MSCTSAADKLEAGHGATLCQNSAKPSNRFPQTADRSSSPLMVMRLADELDQVHDAIVAVLAELRVPGF
jgi:hypothetical protein